MLKKNKKVIVSMSGGVDSAIAAWLLSKQKKYHVEGLFMKNWEDDDNSNYCNSSKDLADARLVCKKLNIILNTVNFSYEYWNRVFKKFIYEYKLGKTPNPDILCNKEIKFKIFLKFATKILKADYISTGHYVRKINYIGNIKLLRALDRCKDQSYYLYSLNKFQLSKTLFPIGSINKNIIRKIARILELPVADKKDSMGICFIGKRNFKNFIKKYIPSEQGKILSIDGNIIGSHNGAVNYTIGQRKGLSIKNKYNDTKPWFVVEKNIKDNILVVVQNKNSPYLMSISIIVKNINWIEKKLIFNKYNNYTVKIRHKHLDINCLLKLINRKKIQVIFKTPILAIAPGQSAVFYKGELCIGGGIIESNELLKKL